jgi:hypothetical protein
MLRPYGNLQINEKFTGVNLWGIDSVFVTSAAYHKTLRKAEKGYIKQSG